MKARSAEARYRRPPSDADMARRADAATAEGLSQGVLVLRRDHPALSDLHRGAWDVLAEAVKDYEANGRGGAQRRGRNAE